MPELYLQQLAVNQDDALSDHGIPIGHFPFVIGRHPECDHVLDHPLISRWHCAFIVKGGEVWIRDLGSRNGTFLNRQRVTEPQSVWDEDLLKLACLFFQVRLGAPALAESADHTVAASAAARHHVLVVDDNVDTAETLAMLLQGWGHEVHLAHDGPGAIRAAQAYQPDTVLLDIRLPGMDGYQVAERLRTQAGLEKARLVGITGYESEQDRRRSQEAGLERLLTKPVDPAMLEGMLSHAG
jgi:CheY-like chemotaxis protein